MADGQHYHVFQIAEADFRPFEGSGPHYVESDCRYILRNPSDAKWKQRAAAKSRRIGRSSVAGCLMLEWFFPSHCPVSPPAKAWVEYRLQWLCDEFDDHVFSGRPVVLPTPRFFPDRYRGTYECVRALLDRVCDFMEVDPSLVDLEIIDTQSRDLGLINDDRRFVPTSVGGTYQLIDGRHWIALDRNELGDLEGTVATFAHELSHARLLGEGRVSGEEDDHELLTDLNTVVFGFGTFLARSPRAWASQMAKWPGTEFNKPEYMSQPLIGYALAHLAWFRGEPKPAWARYLHMNARPDFYQSLRFLNKTGDSEFRPAKQRG